MWVIKKIISKGDYNYALVSKHPNATKNGYVLEHRIVVENVLGRLLKPDEIVHHKDGNRKNNHPDNLEVMNRNSHSSIHGFLRGRKMVTLKCPFCNVIFTKTHNQTFLCKGGRYTCCSRICNGKFSRMIQLNGETTRILDIIDTNVVKQYNSTDAGW